MRVLPRKDTKNSIEAVRPAVGDSPQAGRLEDRFDFQICSLSLSSSCSLCSFFLSSAVIDPYWKFFINKDSFGYQIVQLIRGVLQVYLIHEYYHESFLLWDFDPVMK